jgi:site-specific recombinase XerD
MTRRTGDPFLQLVKSFFSEHLRVRGVSRNTQIAYRDALHLFFSFLAESTGREITYLGLDDVTVDQVLSFLDYLESKRRNGVVTRNSRLTAIRSFCRHLARQNPEHAVEYQRILSLPLKKERTRLVTYLEPEEVQVLLRQPDRRTLSGVRDFALLIFLYNSGARVSEALAVRGSDLQLRRPRQVWLHGKGSKDRICPLWQDTSSALRQLLKRTDLPHDGPIFRNARGEPLTRDGIAYIISKHHRSAAREKTTLRRKRMTPHVMRHSCAVGLLQSGADLTVIRDYLGHASIATTGRYVKTNLQMKRHALNAFWQRAGLAPARSTPWKPTPDTLTFLASL